MALDRGWRYTYVNRRAGEIFGRRPQDLIGKHIWTEFHEGVGQPFHLAYERAMREQTPITLEEYYPPYDGWFENRIYPTPEGLAIYFHDITPRKRLELQLSEAHQTLRELHGHLENAREDERAAIAREIHDELGQMLTGLKMDLSWCKSRLAKGEAIGQIAGKAESMIATIDGTIQSVRAICTRLRPAVLDDLGIIAALEWQAGDFEERTGIPCAFTTALGRIDIGRQLATTVFRIFQESLTNVARHAHATAVTASLRSSSGRLVLEVADNGCGIDAAAAAQKRSFGLMGMRERAAFCGGELEIAGHPGKGTAVVARLPLSGKDA